MTKTAAVTGATGALGRAITEKFSNNQWRTYAASSKNFDVCSEQDTVFWFDGAMLDLNAPVTHHAGTSMLLHSTERHRLDALVTCAGVSLVKPSLEMTAAEWRKVVDVNLTGTFLPIREAVKAGATRIVTIGSIHGSTPTSYPQRAAYAASKAGVVGLTQSLAVELASQGVAVNCVAPGHLPVLMDGTGAGGELLEAARARTPTGKLATPEDVAKVVYWLCNDAPLNLTGQIIVVDGGFSMATFPLL